jgi:hypothetical protein
MCKSRRAWQHLEAIQTAARDRQSLPRTLAFLPNAAATFSQLLRESIFRPFDRYLLRSLHQSWAGLERKKLLNHFRVPHPTIEFYSLFAAPPQSAALIMRSAEAAPLGGVW